jgi:hypothetical protein
VGCGEIAVTLTWMNSCGDGLLDIKTTRRGTLQAANLPDMGGGADVAMYEIVVDMNELAK